ITEIRTYSLDHFRHIAYISARVKVSAIECAFWSGVTRVFATITTHLHADVAIAFVYELLSILSDFLRVTTIGMDVNGGGFTTFAAEQLINRHVRQFALNIPQCHIDAGDRVVQHRTVTPVAVDHHHLPVVFNASDIPTNHERLDMMLKRRVNG